MGRVCEFVVIVGGDDKAAGDADLELVVFEQQGGKSLLGSRTNPTPSLPRIGTPLVVMSANDSVGRAMGGLELFSNSRVVTSAEFLMLWRF